MITIKPSAGVTDHGALTGTSDDDHLQYFKVVGRTDESLTLNDEAKLLWSADGTGTIGRLGLGTATFGPGGGITFTALVYENISVEYIDDGTFPATAGIIGNAITVNLDGDNVSQQSTNTDVYDALIGVPAILAKVSLVNNSPASGFGSGFNATFLTRSYENRPGDIYGAGDLVIDGDIDSADITAEDLVANTGAFQNMGFHKPNDNSTSPSATMMGPNVAGNRIAIGANGTNQLAIYSDPAAGAPKTIFALGYGAFEFTDLSGPTAPADARYELTWESDGAGVDPLYSGIGILNNLVWRRPVYAQIKSRVGIAIPNVSDIDVTAPIQLGANNHPAAQVNTVAIGAADSTGSTRTFSLATEQAVVTDVALASTHSLSIFINGTEYKLALTAV